MPADVCLSKIAQIALPIQDVERAVAFYKEKLGMKHLFSAPPGLAFFDCDGIRLMLSLPEGKSPQTTGSIIYFKVADIQGAYETMLGRGVKFEGKPHLIAKLEKVEIWMAFFRDSENNMLSITSEVPR
jgi:predicted enzyme related to lactoylglutathione lyase